MAYSLALRYPDDVAVKKTALTMSLVRKGRSVTELADAYAILRKDAEQQPGHGWDNLRDARARFARLSLLNGPAAQAGQALADTERIEKSLVAASAIAQFGSAVMDVSKSPELVLSSLDVGLPFGGALVDYVVFRRFDFGGIREAPTWIRDSRIHGFRGQKGGRGRRRGARSSVARRPDRHGLLRGDANPRSDAVAAAKAAYAVLFAPLRDKLRNRDIDYVRPYVYLSPDGELSRVPFDALHDGTAYLLDAFQLAYAKSGRDAFIGSGGSGPASTTVKVFAAPDFSRSVPRGLAVARPEALGGVSRELASIVGAFPKATVFQGAERDAQRAARDEPARHPPHRDARVLRWRPRQRRRRPPWVRRPACRGLDRGAVGDAPAAANAFGAGLGGQRRHGRDRDRTRDDGDGSRRNPNRRVVRVRHRARDLASRPGGLRPDTRAARSGRRDRNSEPVADRRRRNWRLHGPLLRSARERPRTHRSLARRGEGRTVGARASVLLGAVRGLWPRQGNDGCSGRRDRAPAPSPAGHHDDTDEHRADSNRPSVTSITPRLK